MSFNQKLSELVKERRNRLGLTQEDLAERMSVSRVTVTNIEDGKFNPLAKTVFDLAMRLEISITEISKIYYQTYYELLKKTCGDAEK